MVMGHVRSVIESIIPHDSPERFRGMGADVRFGSPRFLLPYEIALNGETVSAAHIVLSMGSEPSIPPIPGLADSVYLTNKTIFSLSKFPERMATIGGGPVGVELS
jgi:pyruvate/2-oxoglutarate dehydrogenase complex dihydrolipoamide dehydrogenase (E3) component